MTTPSFAKFISASRCADERGDVFKRMWDFIQDSNDYHLEIARFDTRGNQDLITRGQVLIAEIEMIEQGVGR